MAGAVAGIEELFPSIQLDDEHPEVKAMEAERPVVYNCGHLHFPSVGKAIGVRPT
jgi:hypothetical protein